MAVNYVGVVVKDFEKLKEVYQRFVDAGYSERHSETPHKMELTRRGKKFALCVDETREILGVFDFGEDSGDVVCRKADVIQVAKAIFPL